MSVAEVMTNGVRTISVAASIREASDMLTPCAARVLLVLDDQRQSVGVVTPFELLTLAASPNDGARPVSDVMAREWLKVDAAMRRVDAARLFAQHAARIAVVMHGDTPTGTISPDHLLNAQTSNSMSPNIGPKPLAPPRWCSTRDRVMLVDGSPVIREILSDALRPAGYTVVCCASGEEVSNRIERVSPELLLLDYLMPGVDGMEVLRRVKQNERTRAIPVIMVTSCDSKSQVSDALAAGAIDYLQKPVTAVEVLARVSSAIHTSRLQRDLETAREDAVSANQAKSEFLANMSHEIRTPMTAILGYAEVLADSLTDDQQRDSIETIRRNGEHLLGLINDILDLSKIVAGQMRIERIACSPRVLAMDVVELLRVRASQRGLSLNVQFEGPIPDAILTDPTRLKQILTNLAGDAVKFTERGGVQLLIRHYTNSANQPYFECRVIDSGVGMTEDEQARLFQPFQQANSSVTRRFGGTGLGLTISQNLAKMLGGAITARSIPGQGSVFTVTVSGEVVEGEAGPSSSHASGQEVSQRDLSELLVGRRVLLAEDGPDNQRLISYVLKKPGAEVTVAPNGAIAVEEAIRALSQGDPFDVILMDMQMPVLDGRSATLQLREQGYTRPILALTANAMESDRQKCLSAGCDDYASKPIKCEDLVRLVARFAEAADASVPAS